MTRPVELKSTQWQSVPPWAELLTREAAVWDDARRAANGGPRVLVTNAYGTDPSIANLCSMLAVALTLRGAEVHLLYCDATLPACWVSQSEFVDPKQFALNGPKHDLCGRCSPGVEWVFNSLKLPVHRHSGWITAEEIETCRQLSASVPFAEIGTYRLDELPVGEHALAGALRFLGRGDLRDVPHGESVLRRYLDAALHTVFTARRLMSSFKFTSVVASHGMYVPEGLICEVARQNDVRVAAWSLAYRRATAVFSHGTTYHHTLMSEPVSTWENMTWTPEIENEIVDYLNSRRYGTRDWIRFTQNPQEDIAAIGRALGADLSKPTIGLLTNVIWDAQLTYPNNAFGSMLEWILESIRYFANRPDLQLVIRVHPGELLAHTRARQTVTQEIQRAFPTLPDNVFIIPPESSIGTYALMCQCNAVIVYGTKTAVELASIGIPVIVAGEAWIRNKGVTMDARSPAEYLQLLDRLPLESRLSPEIAQRARKYAYHFFFRRMIPMPFKGNSMPEPDVSHVEDLSEGRHAGLDVICNGILHGSDFVFPAELYPIAVDEPAKASRESMAHGSFRVVSGLGMIGEATRMRAQIIRTLQEYFDVIEGEGGRGLISRATSDFASLFTQPVPAILDLWREMEAVAVQKGAGKRHLVSLSVADVLIETGIASWKSGSQGETIRAFVHAGRLSPSHLIQMSLMKRVTRYLGLRRPPDLPPTADPRIARGPRI